MLSVKALFKSEQIYNGWRDNYKYNLFTLI